MAGGGPWEDLYKYRTDVVRRDAREKLLEGKISSSEFDERMRSCDNPKITNGAYSYYSSIMNERSKR